MTPKPMALGKRLGRGGHYTYVANNPLAYTDPLGLDLCDPDNPWEGGACAPCVFEGIGSLMHSGIQQAWAQVSQR
jgi:hypothetical protein